MNYRTSVITLIFLLILIPLPLMGGPVLAVLPYEFEGNSLKQITGVEESMVALALTEITSAKLAGLSALTLVDRERLDEMIKEQTLALSGIITEEGAVQAGELLGATHFFSATLVFTGAVVTVGMRITDAEKGTLTAAVTESGPAEEVFSLQEEAVGALIDQWDLPLSRRERSSLAERSELSLQVIGRFGQGLEAQRNGSFEEAKALLAEAVELAPDFTLAREVLLEVEERFESFLQFRATGLPEELTTYIEALGNGEAGASQQFLKRYWALVQPLTMGVSYYAAWAAMPQSGQESFFEGGIKSLWTMLGLTEEPETIEDVKVSIGKRLYSSQGLLELLIKEDLPLNGFTDFMHPLEGALGAFLTCFSAVGSYGDAGWDLPPMTSPTGEITINSGKGWAALILRYGDLMLGNFPYSAYSTSVAPLMQAALEYTERN